jgi:hypothetical protein
LKKRCWIVTLDGDEFRVVLSQNQWSGRGSVSVSGVPSLEFDNAEATENRLSFRIGTHPCQILVSNGPYSCEYELIADGKVAEQEG